MTKSQVSFCCSFCFFLIFFCSFTMDIFFLDCFNHPFLLLSALLLCRRQTAQHKTFCLPLLPLSSHPFLPLILAFCHKLQSESNPPIATSASERRTEDYLCNSTVSDTTGAQQTFFFVPCWRHVYHPEKFGNSKLGFYFCWYKTHQTDGGVLWLVAKVLLGFCVVARALLCRCRCIFNMCVLCVVARVLLCSCVVVLNCF